MSYRHVEELLGKRGVKVDHATINRWVIKYSPILELRFRKYKHRVTRHWHMDETYLKVKGQWVYYYRAVDEHNHTVDFYLSSQRDAKAARCFFEKAINRNDIPYRVTLDKNPANSSGLDYINQTVPERLHIKVRQNKYMNNRIEQDHRAIKRLTNPIMGFKSNYSTVATLTGIELCHMLRKGQFKDAANEPLWQLFDRLVA